MMSAIISSRDHIEPLRFALQGPGGVDNRWLLIIRTQGSEQIVVVELTAAELETLGHELAARGDGSAVRGLRHAPSPLTALV